MSTNDEISIESSMDTSMEIPTVKRSFLPSEEEKIKQSVMVGSVFLALESNFFTTQALLKWLSTAEYNERTQIAYKALCMKINPNDQYLDDISHFLTKKPEYTAIAIGSGLNPEIPDQRSEGLTGQNPVMAHICDALIDVNNNANLRRICALILAGQGNISYIQSKLATCFRARNFPHLRISPNEINIGLIEADWVTRLRYNENLVTLLLRRVTKLQEEAPIYYAGVAYKAYHAVAVKINKDKLLTKLDRDQLITFDTYFPGIIDRKVLQYDELAYKIALLGNDVAGYVLGFPIQNMIPDDDQIHLAIQLLMDMGSVNFADYIRKYVKQTYLPSLSIPCPNVSYSNEQDVMMEDIDIYVPFDIVAYQIGTHIYRFTRTEFSKYAESKKNPYTNDWIPPTVLSTIKARSEAAKEMGLPPARPLLEMLDKIEKGTLFDPDEIPNSTSQQAQNTQQSPHSMELLMAAALLGQWNAGFPLNGDFDGDDMYMNESATQSNPEQNSDAAERTLAQSPIQARYVSRSPAFSLTRSVSRTYGRNGLGQVPTVSATNRNLLISDDQYSET